MKLENLKEKQITKINTGDFVFDHVKQVNYPVAPLVSTDLYKKANGTQALKIRATLYINSKDTVMPSLGDSKVEGTVLTIYYNCDFKNNTPRTCNVFYVEADYTGADAASITQVLSFLNNTAKSGTIESDPPVSRGTVTDPDHDGGIY
jgi:hypothetical protein